MSEAQPKWEGYQETEVIAGAETRLGDMSLDQLMELEAACHERVVEAETDANIVRSYRMSMYPEALADVVSIDLLRARRTGHIRELGQ